MGKLTGAVALVTGAGRGLGRGIAEALAREGAAVAIAARSEDQLGETAASIASHGGRALSLVGDVGLEQDVAAWFRRLAGELGPLDLLVNNAGAFDGGPLDQLDVAAWDRVLATNLRGPFLCTREALRVMKPRGRGRILNIGSIAAQRVRPESAPYAASKHGLWGLTQVTALEGREYGVTCGCLNPGNIRVPRRVESGKDEDEEPMMDVAHVVEAALLMATLPPHVEMLEAVVLPAKQQFVGRG